MRNTAHDDFFHYVFSQVELVQNFILEFFPEDLKKYLDLEKLVPDDTKYLSDEMALLFSDKVWRCPLLLPGKKAPKTEVLIAVLFEHKSQPETYPHIQINGFRQEIWQNSLGNNGRPMPVLPVIFYHGKKPWVKKKLGKYFRRLPPEYQPYIGDFEYLLINVSKYSDEFLLKLKLGQLGSAMILMKHSQDKQYLLEKFHVLFLRGDEYLKTDSGKRFVRRMLVYYSKISEISGLEFSQKLETIKSKNMKGQALSLYDQLILEGEIKGKIEGEIKGEIEGKIKGEIAGKIVGKIEHAVEVAEKVIRKFPSMHTLEVAEISGATMADIEKIKAKIEAEELEAKKTKPKKRKKPAKKQQTP